MKQILHRSGLVGCIVAAVWIATASTQGNCAYAQVTVTPSQNVIYYDGYGQGYYGGYPANYGAPYVRAPNNGYAVYGNGPYGNYPSYGNPVSYGAFGPRTYGASAYRSARAAGYYQGYGYYRGY